MTAKRRGAGSGGALRSVYMKYNIGGFLFFTSLLFFWLLRISFLVKTGGVILATTGRTGQPLLAITRHVPLPQASETKAVSFDEIQFVFSCLCLKPIAQAFNR